MRPLIAQLRAEVLGTLRNGEQLLLVLIIPLGLLVFFSTVDVLPTGGGEAVDFLLPGIVALAVMSTAMVSLGIATGFERSYKVLKRLGATPLGRPRLIAAKTASVVLIELLQLVLLLIVGASLGWSATTLRVLPLIGAVVLGTCAFAGVGLILAGRLRAEVNLAAQNGVYLMLLLSSGMLFDSDKLPSALRAVSNVLPSGALTTVLRDAFGTGASGVLVPGGASGAWLVLAGWSIGAPLVAARLFRWE